MILFICIIITQVQLATMSVITQNIPIKYDTDDFNISFDVEFGKTRDTNDKYRVNYRNPYDIENIDIDGKKAYRILAEEGGFVMKVSNVNVSSKKGITEKPFWGGKIVYKYGLCVTLDLNKEPVYDNNNSLTPSNDVERDGKAWMVYNGCTLQVDQNASAQFQWSTAKALDKGVEPTEEQVLMGVEKRHENSGMIFVSFQPVYNSIFEYDDKDSSSDDETPVMRGFKAGTEATRGLTRGIGGGLTRGLGADTMRSIKKHSSARVGYGKKITTNGTNVDVTIIPNTRYILPARMRVYADEINDKIRCAKDLTSAIRVEELQKNTVIMADED